MLIPAPEFLLDHLNSFDPASAVPAKDAATIAVVRDGDQGLEAFLMRRTTTMKFAAGMYVFPGGGVSEADDEPLAWTGPNAEAWAARFSCDPALARRLVVAAVRETFEETGVLLAGPDEHSVLADTTDLDDARAEMEAGRLSLAQFLTAEKLTLRADLVGAWAHWITPSFEPRRYDTRFFVAALPAGQRIDQVSSEADHSLWAPLKVVLEHVERGTAAMMPPTATTCRELAPLAAAEVVTASAERAITTIEPRPVRIDGQWWLELDREEHLRP